MSQQDAIIIPRKTGRSPDVGPLAAIVSTSGDLALFSRFLKIKENDFQRLFISRLFPGSERNGQPTLAGPVIGAPYAVMLLETLIAWGVRRVIFVGWCGAIDETVSIGDVIIPTAAIIDEGTSRHYGVTAPGVKAPGPLCAELREALSSGGHSFHAGKVWTTDGVYRETAEKVKAHQAQGALAVEMETSALFAVGHFRQIDLGVVLVVSDELSDSRWQPGFKNPLFSQTRRMVCRMVIDLCRKQSTRHSAKK